MTISEKLNKDFGNQIALEQVAPDAFRIYAPFFHEDGDMISMYLEIRSDNSLIIKDFGNTLMRVSYTFELDSPNKINILNNIVKGNYGHLNDGELSIETTLDSLPQAIFQFSQLVAKVSSIDLLKRETIKSLFFERLDAYISENLIKYHYSQNFLPTRDKQLSVDYQIQPKTNNTKPLFLFGVNENTKASKVVISCLSFQKQHLPFRSLVIHEDFENLSSFYRNQITNTVDKQFTSFDDFSAEGMEYIERELEAS